MKGRIPRHHDPDKLASSDCTQWSGRRQEWKFMRYKFSNHVLSPRREEREREEARKGDGRGCVQEAIQKLLGL